MPVRATSLALLFAAIVLGQAFLGQAFLGHALAADRGGAPVPPAAPSEFPVASEVRLGGDDQQTRMVVDISDKIDVRAFTLANPYRVVIDMPQVTFQLPPRT